MSKEKFSCRATRAILRVWSVGAPLASSRQYVSLQQASRQLLTSQGAVVKATCESDVRHVLIFTFRRKIPIVVCGGGHSSSGASSVEGGIVIDLSEMRAVQVNTDDMTVTFEGGCLWSDVDAALEQHGLATVGGVVNHTGVGGLTLGGGHGWLTPLHGLTIDNLVSAQMVLRYGQILKASAEENPDLFWAIRGAGAQFGVVTSFTLRVHKQGKVWSGILGYSEDKLDDLVAVANESHDRHNKDGHCLALGIGYASDGVTHGISAIPLFHGPEAEAKQYFSKLLAIESITDSTEMMTIAKVNTLLNPIFEHGRRRLMGSSNITMPVDPHALQQTATLFWDFCDTRSGLGKSVLAIEFFPTDKVREVPIEATAYANRGDYYDAITAFGWTDPKLDHPIREFNRTLCEQIRSTNGYSREGDEGPVGKYINIEAEKMEPKDAYGVNLERLRELKKKYDPFNVFNKWHGINE